jgi:hypothetical protein
MDFGTRSVLNIPDYKYCDNALFEECITTVLIIRDVKNGRSSKNHVITASARA